MQVDSVVVIATFIVQCISLLAGAVWFVANMQSNTAKLQATIEHLAGTIDGLKEQLRETEDRQREQERRLALLEERHR